MYAGRSLSGSCPVEQERTQTGVLLNLPFSAPQKALLALLVHYPVLTLANLLFHLRPVSTQYVCCTPTARSDTRFYTGIPILRMENIPPQVSWRKCKWYEVTELGLRFLAMRHGVTPAHYHLPLPKGNGSTKKGEKLDRRKISPARSL